jgi:hypothetical protein
MKQLAEQLLSNAGIEAIQREACRIRERATEPEDLLILLGRVDHDRTAGRGRLRP